MVETLKQADSTNLYRDMLILRLRDISDLYGALLSKYAKITIDEDVFNSFLSEMIVVSVHLIAKLEGSGEKAKGLLEEFEEFEPWLDDISKPKIELAETKKVHKLFRLILRAYDFLGLSGY